MQHVAQALITSDGLKLHTEAWLPESPRALLLISHGYAEHLERYQPLASYLVGEQVAVYAVDHRGHGKSEGERANVRVFREYIDDLKRFVEQLREQHQGLPRFLLGHSMGGVIAAQMVLEYPLVLDGLLLSAGFFQNAVKVSPLLMSVSGIAAKMLPSLPTVKLDTSLLSRDAEVVRRYNDDPLVYTGGTKARQAKEMLAAGEYVLKHAANIKMPTLVMHGTADRIADPAGSQNFYDAISSTDKALKLYDGYYHEILNEIGKEAVYEDIIHWIRERLRIE